MDPLTPDGQSTSIRSLLRRAALAYLDRRERRLAEPRQVIWLLGHMRSGSTLLAHVLSSHPQITGAGERNATYATPDDLRRLSVDAAYARRQLFRDADFVVDQINHSRFLAAPELLDHPRVRKIFLIREPRAAIASMVEVLGKFYGMTLEEAVAYYLERLPALADGARRVADRGSAFFLTYDELVESPGPVLRRLETFLGLRSPLSERYRLFNFTGRRGDPSRRIRGGRIQRHPPRRIDLEAPTLERLRAAYSRASRVLTEHCAPRGDSD